MQPDGLVREAQPELVDDQAEVAEVERAGEELEPVVPRLALDERQRVAVERVHAVADRRPERDEVAERDAVARAVAAHDHVLGPRADVAAHELLRVLEAAAAEDDRAARGARARSGPVPRDRPRRRRRARPSRRGRRRAPRRPAAARRRGAVSAHGPRAPGPPTDISRPRPIRSLRQATGGSSGIPCPSSHDHASSISSTRIRCSAGSPRGIQRRASSNVAGDQIRPPLIAIDPPTEGSLSSTRTSPPASAAASAAVSPAMPPPTTITSRDSLTRAPFDIRQPGQN